MELAIDGAALIREAHERRAAEESLQDSLRRVVTERYPDHREEVMRATRLLLDMMNLMEGGKAQRVNHEVLQGRYRLSMVLEVPERNPSAGAPRTMTVATRSPCPRCGGEYLKEFNFCVACGSLWPTAQPGLWSRLLRTRRKE